MDQPMHASHLGPDDGAPDVLLATWDPDTRAILTAVFTQAGLRVDITVDATDAVEHACRRRPVIVVTSFPNVLPDGRNLTQALRADARTASLPVVSVTNHALPAELEAAALAGVTVSLPMPVSPTRVLEEVCRLLGRDAPP